MIRVENLVKKYGDHVVVDHLSFTVERGQIYGFLGPNGAGKTTTMNMITGYLAATDGTIEINGFDILSQPQKAKQCIGYLPEIPPLYPDMTVLEYLCFAAELKKVPRKERQGQIQDIMQMVEISDAAGRLIKNLSKGYKQRVGLAQAIIGYPDVIILDEPMTGLDPKQITEIRALIKKLSEEHTIILSSHILSEVSTLCNYIMIISQGRLVAGDSPEGLQKLMEKSIEIEVTALGDRERAAAVLDGIGHIRSYVFEDSAEENSIKIRIITEDNTDIRRELSIAFANGDMPIVSMNKREQSLEDIFLQLTEASVAESEETEEGEEAGEDGTCGENDTAEADHLQSEKQERVEQEGIEDDRDL